jgi:methylenetetrahydrofolate dehydrogenase (NADP+)/methenyltetrahydrofolate cyclohydrolase
MKTRILNGKKESEKILADLKKKIKKEKIKPSLAVISIGKNSSSEVFVRNKKKAGNKIGISVSEYKFESNVEEKVILDKIESLNKDETISGIIVQLPLPKKFNSGKIISKISPRKDVDAFCGGKEYFDQPLPNAIFFALGKSGKNFRGKKIVALTNSDIFGKTLKEFLGRKKINAEYFLRKSVNPDKLRSADVIISVCGVPGFMRSESIKEGVVLIDGGIVVAKEKTVFGDVDKSSVLGKASFLTPVPGGIGPLNVAFLLKNVYLSAKKHG